MNQKLRALAERILSQGLDGAPSLDEARPLTDENDVELDELLFWAARIRKRFFGDGISCCSIVSVRTGACSEDCAFCAQSARHSTGIKTHAYLPKEAVAKAAAEARHSGSFALGVVSSGRGPAEKDLGYCLEYLAEIRKVGIEPHVSIGIVDQTQIARLREAGMTCFCHNLETGPKFFPKICSTHSFEERLRTLEFLRAADVRICSGGLFGMGESWMDRLEMALTLRPFRPATVPLNFLHPIPGTPLGCHTPLRPLEILRIIAVYRFLLPTSNIGVYGGREANLRDVQALIFNAGASAFMLGNYLTTTGRPADIDRQMLRDLELTLVEHKRESSL